MLCCFFFFNDTATTEIYTLSLHDALPISGRGQDGHVVPTREPPGRVDQLRQPSCGRRGTQARSVGLPDGDPRSEEHTSELQSRPYLVCRLLLDKKHHLTNLVGAVLDHTTH